MAKLWKGVFYCFWMSDKPLVQQALASELAEILLTISTTSSSLAFLRGFWEMTVREWSSIDRLRLDKYYMLLRRFVNASFRLLIRNEWDDAVCREYNSILTDRGGPLCPSDTKVPPSLAYHLADIYLEELNKALTNSPSSSPLESPPSPAPLSTLLSPFFTLAARTSNNTTYQRIQSALLDPIFAALKVAAQAERAGEDEDGGPDRKRRRLDAQDYPSIVSNSCATNPRVEGAMESGKLRAVLLKSMFEFASEAETRDANRRKLYALRKANMDDEEDSADAS